MPSLKQFFLLALFITSHLTSAKADIIYVDTAANGTEDGSSWSNAFTDLQAALDIANFGDDIWIAEGAYRPTKRASFNYSRSATYQLISGVSLYGGFPTGGGDGTINARDYTSHITTFSGDLGLNDTSASDISDNAYHVITADSLNETTHIDGIYVTAGNAVGSYPYNYGAAVYLTAGSPTFKNCSFTNNSASANGGAITAIGCNAKFENCTFSGNTATRGGAIYAQDKSNLILTACVISNNVASLTGAGIYNFLSCSPIISNCSFENNSVEGSLYSTGGGAIHNSNYCHATIENTNFSNNTASVAGAIYNNRSSPKINNCEFKQNSAGIYADVIYNSLSSPTFSNCLIQNDSIESLTMVYNSGGSSNYINTLFISSTAPYATDISSTYDYDDSNSSYLNCTIIGNPNGVLNIDSSSPTFQNCIIGEPIEGDYTPIRITETSSASAPSFHNCIIPNSFVDGEWNSENGSIDLGRNVDTDPKFVVKSAFLNNQFYPGIYKVTSESPAIDSANYTLYQSGTDQIIDLAGLDRTIDHDSAPDTGLGSITYLDVGAYEHKPNTNQLYVHSIRESTAYTPFSDEVILDIIFSDDVLNFDALDDLIIQFTGTAQVSSFELSGTGSVYQFTLRGVEGYGTCSIAINPNAGIEDLWGNSLASNAEENSYTIDFYTGSTIIVDPSSTNPTQPYNTWKTATHSLQTALELASEGDTIWVAEGTYYPSVKSHENSPTSVTFTMPSNVLIMGGFPQGGGSGSIDARDPELYPTVLSGDIDRDDSDSSAHDLGNASRVVLSLNNGSHTTLDGLTITHGYTVGQGAAIYIDSGELNLTNCQIKLNESLIHAGAIYNHEAKLTINNCTFSSNYCDVWGGAIYNLGGELNIQDSSFIDNRSANRGGAICNESGQITVSRSLFHKNICNDLERVSDTGWAGAIYNATSDLVSTIEDCTFSENLAGKRGGAILNNEAPTIITSCDFSSNSATLGGALYNLHCDSLVTNCLFENNSTSSKSGAVHNNNTKSKFVSCNFLSNHADIEGGACFHFITEVTYEACVFQGNTAGETGGAIHSAAASDVMINCEIVGNSAGIEGGALYSAGVGHSLINNTISGNSAPSGAAMANVETSTPTLTNCILWANTSANAAPITNDAESQPSYAYSIIASSGGSTDWDSSIGEDLGGNTDSNPLFVTPFIPQSSSSYDLRLLAGSPAINAGDGSSDLSINTTPNDILGNPRFVDTIDQGAYEGSVLSNFSTRYPSLSAEHDDNGNGRSNYEDYILGIDPRMSSAQQTVTPVAAQLDDNVLSIGFLDPNLAADAVSYFEKSSDLVNWQPMEEGVDYQIISQTNQGNQIHLSLELTQLPDPDVQCFYRRATQAPLEIR